jgi:hypothetical protein
MTEAALQQTLLRGQVRYLVALRYEQPERYADVVYDVFESQAELYRSMALSDDTRALVLDLLSYTADHSIESIPERLEQVYDVVFEA